MPITSFIFLGLVAIILLAYYVLPRRAQNILLLLASYAFYIAWSWKFMLVLVSITLLSYVLAQSFGMTGRWRVPLLWMGIAAVLAVMIFFKYADFFLPDLQSLLRRVGIEVNMTGLKILLPVGLSYYGLQAISFLIDGYHGRNQEPAHLMEYALYLSYFPKLLSGPIESPSHFLPQLTKDRVVVNEDLTQGFTLIVLGFIRKRLIADSLFAIIPGNIFVTPSDYNAPALLFWLFTQIIAVYNDFAGYTYIARGLSRLFGIRLSRNFRFPFFAHSFRDIWTRWHITLSEWLRNTIYLPLTRAFLRRYPNPRYLPTVLVPTVVTMMASALWHGMQVNFVIWGLIITAIVSIERVRSLYWPVSMPEKQPAWRQGLRSSVIFCLVVLTLVPFFTASASTALSYYNGITKWFGSFTMDFRVIILAALSFGMDLVQSVPDDEFIFLRWPVLVQSTLLALALLVIFTITRADMSTPFVYQGF